MAIAIVATLIADVTRSHAVDLFAGYSALRARRDFVHGATLAASWARGPRGLRLGVESTAHSGSSAGESLRELAVLAGVAFAPWRAARLSPFVSLKVGAARARRQVEVFGVAIGREGVCDTGGCHEMGPAGEIGGGLDLRLGDRWALRLAQADYRFRRFEGETERGLRLSAGIVRR